MRSRQNPKAKERGVKQPAGKKSRLAILHFVFCLVVFFMSRSTIIWVKDVARAMSSVTATFEMAYTKGSKHTTNLRARATA